MTVQEALNVLSQVCASVSANLETHKKMQEALQVVAVAVKNSAEEAPKAE